MGYSYVFLGDLHFESGAQKVAWRESALDGRRFDSPADWSYKKGSITVADVLAYFAGELCLVEDESTTLKLRAVVDKGGKREVKILRRILMLVMKSSKLVLYSARHASRLELHRKNLRRNFTQKNLPFQGLRIMPRISVCPPFAAWQTHLVNGL